MALVSRVPIRWRSCLNRGNCSIKCDKRSGCDITASERRSPTSGGSDAFIVFNHKRHPRELSEIEVSAFLSHLAEVRRVSASTQNQDLSALLFLYRHVLRQELGQLAPIVRAKRSEHLPVVQADEWTAVFD